MTTILSELNHIITLLEAHIPANPQSPANQKRQDKLQRDMAKYFRDLEDAFPYSKLAAIYNRNVRESLSSDTKGMVGPLLATFNDELKAMLSGQMAEVYLSGQVEVISWGKTFAGVPIAFEGPPISQAVAWAREHSATAVKQMGEETQRRLALTISNGIAQKRGIPALATDIRKTFADMTQFRSELIAKTETADALSAASLDNMANMGVEGKEWITVGDAKVDTVDCLPNEAQGVIPVGQAFQSGHMAPTAHPG